MSLPDNNPFWAPDCSNRRENFSALSGVKGGTLMGPPLPWVCNGLRARFDVGNGGADISSNLGRGPPAIRSQLAAASLCCVFWLNYA